MSNSVVKVTDSMLNDSLFLLVGEDGTVTPDKETVETYLSAQTGVTNIQLMHVNKSDGQSIDVAVENVVYAPDADSNYVMEGGAPTVTGMEQILSNIRLDHDYTTRTEAVEEDELVKTLTQLESGIVDAPKLQTPQKHAPERNAASKPQKIAKAPAKPFRKTRTKAKPISTKYEIDDDYKDEDFELDSDEKDDDFEQKTPKRPKLTPKKAEVPESKPKPQLKPLKIEKAPIPQSPEVKSPPKIPKKEKKPVKPIPDDFALFSTPDIIRRVGGKEENIALDTKPAKVERSHSANESNQNVQKPSRLSLDGKPVRYDQKRLSIDAKTKRTSTEMIKKPEKVETPLQTPTSSFSDQLTNELNSFDAKSMYQALDLNHSDQHNLTIDGTGLDLDPTLLDNINNDLINEDLLYQVAQSLVSNTELQNAIDKSLNESNLTLDSPLNDVIDSIQAHSQPLIQLEPEILNQKGTHIVRPDGRIVVIPPIERPTTRSRNKKKEINNERPKVKSARKPLDEEHVSGNELDSSGEEGEEEGEDDPNKLWCVCNQPHNNRFMICCDTCEEWYHGKCVNITKAMGQQMESEGKEWICRFCQDSNLKRPQAAARRIRKASRNSRQSTDSVASGSKVAVKQAAPPGTIPCVVCHKQSRNSSIYCSENCILAHAQGVERVVVCERSTGTIVSGNDAPSASQLEQWLKEHPGHEVVRSAGKLLTTKSKPPSMMTQSRLKLIKNPDNDGVSLAIAKKGVNVGLMKHSPKLGTPQKKAVIIKALNKPKIEQSPIRKTTPSKPPTSSPINKPKPVVNNKTVTVGGKEKAVPVKTPKARQTESTPPQPKQENIRENVQKTIFEQLTNRLKLAEDLKLTEEDLKSISSEIESQLYKCFGDTGQKYRNKYRSLIFNIKDVKNQTLWRRICEKSINPYQLVRLSPDDLASQELALWREREAKHQLDMIKKSELELLNCNRQYVLKTHKGEEVLEDNRPNATAIESTEVLTSLTETGKLSADSSSSSSKKDHYADKKTSKHGHNKKASRSDSKEHRSNKDHDRNRKRERSRSRERKHSERRRSRSGGRDKHRRSSHKSSRHKKDTTIHRSSTEEKLDKKSKEIFEQLVDKNIVPPLEDKLWREDLAPKSAESDSDHEPTSTVTIPTPPRSSEFEEFNEKQATEDKNGKPVQEEAIPEPEEPAPKSPKAESKEIWRGTINMVDVAQISISAFEVTGDCNGLGNELPPNLDIVGRISPDTVWDYIGKMKCSNSKIISVVRLNAINVEEKMPYLALYSYLLTRNRLGVVKSNNKAVKDFYIWPQAASVPIPEALQPISGPGFEENRPALLLGIIVRDRRKRHIGDGVSGIGGNKKSKIEVLVVPSSSARSYTPPPVKESKPKLPLPPPILDQDDDEPYSPEDSDPEAPAPVLPAPPALRFSPPPPLQQPSTFLEPFSNKFDDVGIPGLESAPVLLPSSTLEIQLQMEKLNKEIEAQKSEIDSLSQNIVTDSSEIGTTALANIALPSNLQQILDSIKTIGAVEGGGDGKAVGGQETSDLTIPLLLPTSFAKKSNVVDVVTDSIPLNLPGMAKKAGEGEKMSVLSSLSEEDLIRKAEEMLGEGKSEVIASTSSAEAKYTYVPSVKNIEAEQPPIPGLEDEPFV